MFEDKRKFIIAGLFWLFLARPAGAELHDPTLPANLASDTVQPQFGQEAMLKVTAIRISSKSRYAIINGKSVAVGETLGDGTKVLKISLRSVWVIRNGDKKKLTLVPPVKKPVK